MFTSHISSMYSLTYLLPSSLPMTKGPVESLAADTEMTSPDSSTMMVVQPGESPIPDDRRCQHTSDCTREGKLMRVKYGYRICKFHRNGNAKCGCTDGIHQGQPCGETSQKDGMCKNCAAGHNTCRCRHENHGPGCRKRTATKPGLLCQDCMEGLHKKPEQRKRRRSS